MSLETLEKVSFLWFSFYVVFWLVDWLRISIIKLLSGTIKSGLLWIWMDRSFKILKHIRSDLLENLCLSQVGIMHCPRAIICASVCPRWAVSIALENSLPHCGIMLELQDRTLKQIKRNKTSSIRLMGKQVVSTRRGGPRELAEPTPLFFTPTGSIWWGMEIWCRPPGIVTWLRGRKYR